MRALIAIAALLLLAVSASPQLEPQTHNPTNEERIQKLEQEVQRMSDVDKARVEYLQDLIEWKNQQDQEEEKCWR